MWTLIQLFILKVQRGRTSEKDGGLKQNQNKAKVTRSMAVNWHSHPPRAALAHMGVMSSSDWGVQ